MPDDAAGLELCLEFLLGKSKTDMIDVVQPGTGYIDYPGKSDGGNCRRHASKHENQGIEDKAWIDSASHDTDTVRLRALV